MARNVIAALNEWDRKHRKKYWTRWEIVDRDGPPPDRLRITTVLQEFESSVRHTFTDPSHVVEREWKPEITPAETAPMARCRLVAFNGDEAECVVLVDGFELPRVSFPASVLRLKGLDVGSRFIWIMRRDSRIRAVDIDPDVPQTDDLTSEERAELDRLYETFQRRRVEDAGEWPEYTGDGR